MYKRIAIGKRNFVGKSFFFLVTLIMVSFTCGAFGKSSLTFFTNNYMGLNKP